MIYYISLSGVQGSGYEKLVGISGVQYLHLSKGKPADH